MRILTVIVLVLFLRNLQGQDMRDHWVFGDSMHLHFTDLGVVELPSVPLFSSESSSSISDTLGNLLFYGNHDKILNAENQILDGGDSLNQKLTNSTSTQGFMILPIGENRYMCFYSVQHTGPSASLAVCIVDMSLSGGLGGILPKEKRIILIDSVFGEQLQAVRHANGSDWWIIVRLLEEVGSDYTDRFGILLLHKEMVRMDKVINIGDPVYFAGELAVSPNGGQLGLVTHKNGIIQLFDFDRCVGTISNPRKVLTGVSTAMYGCEFSPSDSFFYYVYSASERLFQMNVNTLEVIQLSGSFSSIAVGAGQLELGPDGKIYLVYYANSIFGCEPYCRYLGVINEPNAQGILSSFDPFGVGPLSRPNRGRGLPNHPNYYLGPLVGSPCDTLSIPPDTTTTSQPLLPVSAEQCFELKVDVTGHFIHVEPKQLFTNAILEVYTSSGVMHFTEPLDLSPVRIKTQDWPAGLYVVTLRAPQARCPSTKFVVGGK